MSRGNLIVVSGPSGAGKDTVIEKVMQKCENVKLSISATTREIRPNETDGVNYFFMTEDEFLKIKKEDGFLESAVYCDNYYGTPKKFLFEQLDKGIDVILIIETQGAMSIRREYPEGVFIFVIPPTIKELRSRLENRGTESEEAVALRMEKALIEIEKIDKYNYIVFNGSLEKAADEIVAIIKAERLRTVYQDLQNIKERFKNDN